MQESNIEKKNILTGDRPTGNLHLGHYVGSLQNRVLYQNTHNLFILIADIQALTDNSNRGAKLHENILEVALDYLAAGIDPKKSTVFVQSGVPEIHELTLFFLNHVSIERLKQNPTVKEEINQKKWKDFVPAGFVVYPVSQAADISIVKADYVPAGIDQTPMLELQNDIARRFNQAHNVKLFPEAKLLLSQTPRLMGIDGQRKMSKSLNNAININEPLESMRKKVRKMYSGSHKNMEDPGSVEDSLVFQYLEAFDPERQTLEELKDRYKRGGVSDSSVKERLSDVLEALLIPMQEKRREYEAKKEEVIRWLEEGTSKTRKIAQETMRDVYSALGLRFP